MAQNRWLCRLIAKPFTVGGAVIYGKSQSHLRLAALVLYSFSAAAAASGRNIIIRAVLSDTHIRKLTSQAVLSVAIFVFQLDKSLRVTSIIYRQSHLAPHSRDVIVLGAKLFEEVEAPCRTAVRRPYSVRRRRASALLY